MLRGGLVSITFRSLTSEAVIDLVAKSGLHGIEWGGDVHVPHGDLAAARDVGRRTRDAGLAVAAYGSYYRLSHSETDGLAFECVLDNAVALGAPLIRVWVGDRASRQADDVYIDSVARDAARIADLAAQANVDVAFEFHTGTLTDTPASCRDLLDRVQRANLRTLWQPMHGETMEHNLAGLRLLADRLANVHVFHWWPTPAERLPLSSGADRWAAYLKVAKAAGARWALLEFVAGDSPDAFLRDAAELNRLL
jgi:sugar phosphate isomerase/epimerase